MGTKIVLFCACLVGLSLASGCLYNPDEGKIGIVYGFDPDTATQVSPDGGLDAGDDLNQPLGDST